MRVLLYTGNGTSIHRYIAKFQQMMASRGFELVLLDHIPPNITPQMFDAVLFPGGSGESQSISMGAVGRECIQSFVENGGGYVGVCGGAFLGATSHYGLGLLPLKCWTQHLTDEVSGKVLVQLNTSPLKKPFVICALLVSTVLFGFSMSLLSGLFVVSIILSTFWFFDQCLECHFHNGPLFDEAALPEHVNTMMTIRRGVGSNAKGMVGKAMAVIGTYGKGRVVLCGGHPEQTDSKQGEELVLTLMRSVLPQSPSIPSSSPHARIQCDCLRCSPPSTEVVQQKTEKFKRRFEALRDQWYDTQLEPVSPQTYRRLEAQWRLEAATD